MLLRPARHADLPAVHALLNAAGLHEEGIDGFLATLIVGESRRAVVTAGAMEPLGRVVLLRGIVVAPHCRGRGWGVRITGRLLDLAQRIGMAEAWLLTRTTPEFFTARGFEPVSRQCAPAAVRATYQFSVLCPADAVLMRRSLAMLPVPSP